MHTVIIGGGISGLATAYYLEKAGLSSTIVESRPRLGGVIQTEHIEGCTVEAGPDSFLSTKPAALELIRELGLAGDVIGSNDHLRVTFVKKNGRLVPLPEGLMMMIPTRVMPLIKTPLLSLGTKARMAMEYLRPPKPPEGDVSVADFIRERYGQETVDYLAEPLLSGIYGGDPCLLSAPSVLPRFIELAKQYGSLSRGVLASRAKAPKASSPAPLFTTLKGGLGQLVHALDRPYTRGRAETIERANGGYRVRVDGQWMSADHVVLACEAHAAAPLIAGLDPSASPLFAGVDYTSSVLIALGYDARDVQPPPRGFGFLVPKKERRRLFACTWIGTKFPNRVPEDKLVARCFVGGEAPESDAEIAAIVADELRELTGITAKPRFTNVSRWPRGMAQYHVGHAVRIAALNEKLAALPGIHVAGNAYSGIGIPDCIRMGRAAADSISRAQ